MLLCLSASAQEEKIVNISLEQRTDLEYTKVDGVRSKEETGFRGYIMNLIIKGQISPSFSYAYRQRLNAINKNAAFFDTIDWVFLNYHANSHLTFTIGKAPVGVAGWELDLAPIDCFFLSSFNYHYAPYQWGGSATYTFPGTTDNLMVQIVESPFKHNYAVLSGGVENMYGYSLKWGGRHGIWEPNWSANLMEYAPGKFINYLSLGNRLHFTDQLQLELDYMNRASEGKDFLAKDFTLVGRLAYQPTTKWNMYVKGTWDVNKTESSADYVVTPGTDIVRVGGGVEYYPLASKNIRLHGNYSYSVGTNTQPNPFVRDRLSMLNLGVTWRLKIL